MHVTIITDTDRYVKQVYGISFKNQIWPKTTVDAHAETIDFVTSVINFHASSKINRFICLLVFSFYHIKVNKDSHKSGLL